MVVWLLLLLTLCSAVNGNELSSAKAKLLQHIKSGAAPDAAYWSTYEKAYHSAHTPVPAKPKEGKAVDIPMTKWSQTKSKLTVTVQIPAPLRWVGGHTLQIDGCTARPRTAVVSSGPDYSAADAVCRGDPYVAFGQDTVQVTATSHKTGKDYELSLKLHKSIKKGAFTLDGLGKIYLTIKKAKPGYWPQLLHRKPKGALKRAIEIDWANWIDEEDMSSEDDDIDEDDVHNLREDNFDQFIQATPVTLVVFTAPWCTHCKRLKPEYAKAATQLKEKGIACKLAQVPTAHAPGPPPIKSPG